MRFITKLNHKLVDAVIFPTKKQAGVHNCVRSDESAEGEREGQTHKVSTQRQDTQAHTHPKQPGHHFMDVSVGESMMNSSLAGSNVAVVSSPLTLDP